MVKQDNPPQPSGTEGGQVCEVTPNVQFDKIKAGEEKSLLAMVSLQTTLCDENARPGLDLSIVVDVSGSMSENMSLMKSTLSFLVKQLHQNDSLSLVSFDTDVHVNFSHRMMNASNKSLVQESISKMRASGCTNLSGGLLAGFDQISGRLKANQDQEANRMQTVMLFTDGIANEGITDSDKIILTAKNVLKTIPSTSLYTFGFGANHSEALLRGLADSTGNGMYYFIENSDQIAEMFVDCVGGLLSVVGQQVKLTISPMNQCLIGKFLSDYQHTMNEDGSIVANMNDLFSEEHRDLLWEVRVPASTSPGKEEILSIASYEVVFLNTNTCDFERHSGTINVTLIDTEDSSITANLTIDEHHNQILTSQGLESGRNLADLGNLSQAQDLLLKLIERIKQSVSAESPISVSLIAELNEVLQDMKSREQYRNAGSKKMALKSKMLSKQKCSAAMQKKRDMMRAFKEQQQATSSPSAITFTIGNHHTLLSEEDAPQSKSRPELKCTHQWKAFVQCSKPECVEKVVFRLHDSFQEPEVEVTSAPWEIERKGWGFFTLPITVYFSQDPAVNPKGIQQKQFYLDLNFNSSLHQETHQVELN